MKLDALTPMLMCKDVQASIAFYTEALGFTVRARMDALGKSGWATLEHGHVHLMLASPTYIPDGVHVDGRFPQAVYYFYPDDVAALRASLVEKGHSPTELEDRFYGMREFELVDPDGHVLLFGQEIEPFPHPKA